MEKKHVALTQIFKENFVSKPIVYAQIWEDLHMMANPDAKINAGKVDINQLLMALFFLTIGGHFQTM